MGSIESIMLFRTVRSAYILGLWLADGYSWSSSIGLSSADIRLLERFAEFLMMLFPKNRLRLRIYQPANFHRDISRYLKLTENVVKYPHSKARQPNCHLYVNSRPLLREFRRAENKLLKMPNNLVPPYFAGRFDGDGSVDQDFRRDCRIVYSNLREAEQDRRLIKKNLFISSTIYYYKTAKTYCLYISRMDAPQFLKNIKPYSVVLNDKLSLPRRD